MLRSILVHFFINFMTELCIIH